MSLRRGDADAPHDLLAGVQLLRGAAAMLVVLAHANGMMRYPRYFGASPFELENIGVFGVAVFFVISGFIIATVSLRADLGPDLSILDYARRRFIRIIPFLWVCVMGYNLLTTLGHAPIEWPAALRALVAWPVGDLKPNVVWSLRHEFIFYALFAFAMLGAKRRYWLLVAWFAAPLLAAPFYPALQRAYGATRPDLVDLYKTVLLGGDNGANMQFAAGFALGLLRLRGGGRLPFRVPLGALAALIAIIAATCIAQATPLGPGPLRQLMWTAMAFVVVLVGVAADSKRGVLRRLGMVLGDASFSIYLVHNAALLGLLEATRHITTEAPAPVFLAGFVVAAGACGVAVHHALERPLISGLTRALRSTPARLRSDTVDLGSAPALHRPSQNP